MGITDSITGAIDRIGDAVGGFTDSNETSENPEVVSVKKAFEDLGEKINDDTLIPVNQALVNLVESIQDPEEKRKMQEIIDTQITPLIDEAKLDGVYNSEEKDELDAKVGEILGEDHEEKTFAELAESLLQEHPKLREFLKHCITKNQADLGVVGSFFAGEAAGIIEKIEAGEVGTGGDAEDESANDESNGDESDNGGNEEGGEGGPAGEDVEDEPVQTMSTEEVTAFKEKISDEESLYALMNLEEIQGEPNAKTIEARNMTLGYVNASLKDKTKARLSNLDSEHFTAYLPGESGSETIFTIIAAEPGRSKFKVQIGDGSTKVLTSREWNGSLEELPNVLGMEEKYKLDEPEEGGSSQQS